MTDLTRLRLARTDGVGPVTYRRLLRRYGNPDAALAALPALARAGGRAAPPQIPSEAAAAREAERVARMGGRFLFVDAPGYPTFLGLLEDAPAAIAVLGNVGVLAARAVAIVGSRNASSNGLRLAENLGRELANAGLAVVSGMARGIDGAAHEGALRAGTTIACVAGGLDLPYPPEHAGLQQRIATRGGAVVAEAPLGTAPLARHFPRRNRIIAGLSLGVVVVEAAVRSGSLGTAQMALDAGRELFAVPGSPLDPRCRGSNGLLREHAHLTETAEDVLRHLPDDPRREGLAREPLFARAGAALPDSGPIAEPYATTMAPGDAAEAGQARAQVLELLGPSPTSVDDLLRRCQFSASTIISVLLELELAGRVETLPGNRVSLLAP